MRVVVAGAGFAGLMAASELAHGGCEVVVLEARDRVGGRVWSQELIPGDPRTVIERGAEFVLDGYDVLREMLPGLGLELAGTTMSYYEREPRGGEPVSTAEAGECAAWVGAAAKAAAPGACLAEVAAGWAGRPGVLAAYLARMETTAGASADRLSADAADLSGHVQPVLHAFAGTESALSGLGVASGPAGWASQAAALRPDLDTDPGRALLTTWNDDPWAGESYTADLVTAAPGDQDILAAPAGRIHFAGEHTAGHRAGLMEGALRSGRRAAAEVLAGQPAGR